MHIAEGILSAPVLMAGAAAGAAGVGIGLHRLDDRSLVKVAVLSSAFFVASLIKVPLGPVSVHLILNGLTGLLLGWAVFPAVAVALLLQALLFGFGGLTTLGVNTVIMGLPGLASYYLFHRIAARSQGPVAFMAGFMAGAFAIALGGLLLAATLMSTGEAFWNIAGVALGAHVPIMLVEGCVTGSAVVFLNKVRPGTLCANVAPPILEAQPGAEPAA